MAEDRVEDRGQAPVAPGVDLYNRWGMFLAWRDHYCGLGRYIGDEAKWMGAETKFIFLLIDHPDKAIIKGKKEGWL